MTHPGVTGRKPDAADAPDQLVPDGQVRFELGGLSPMGLHRWENDPALKEPVSRRPSSCATESTVGGARLSASKPG